MGTDHPRAFELAGLVAVGASSSSAAASDRHSSETAAAAAAAAAVVVADTAVDADAAAVEHESGVAVGLARPIAQGIGRGCRHSGASS